MKYSLCVVAKLIAVLAVFLAAEGQENGPLCYSTCAIVMKTTILGKEYKFEYSNREGIADCDAPVHCKVGQTCNEADWTAVGDVTVGEDTTVQQGKVAGKFWLCGNKDEKVLASSWCNVIVPFMKGEYGKYVDPEVSGHKFVSDWKEDDCGAISNNCDGKTEKCVDKMRDTWHPDYEEKNDEDRDEEEIDPLDPDYEPNGNGAFLKISTLLSVFLFGLIAF